MTREQFLAGEPFELPVPQFGRIYRYRPQDGGGYLGYLECANRYHQVVEWIFFAHVDDIRTEWAKVVGYWFTELLVKELPFAGMKIFEP